LLLRNYYRLSGFKLRVVDSRADVLFGFFGAGGFAECGELRMEEFCGQAAGEGFDCFALLGGEGSEF
jgi:hypothetical protein